MELPQHEFMENYIQDLENTKYALIWMFIQSRRILT